MEYRWHCCGCLTMLAQHALIMEWLVPRSQVTMTMMASRALISWQQCWPQYGLAGFGLMAQIRRCWLCWHPPAQLARMPLHTCERSLTTTKEIVQLLFSMYVEGPLLLICSLLSKSLTCKSRPNSIRAVHAQTSLDWLSGFRHRPSSARHRSQILNDVRTDGRTDFTLRRTPTVGKTSPLLPSSRVVV